jgi:RIMS-binding protein 2
LKFIILHDFARLQMPGGMQNMQGGMQQNMQQNMQRGVMGMGGMQGPRPQNPQNVMNQQGMNPMNQMNPNQMQQQNRMPMQPGQQPPRPMGQNPNQNPNQQRKLRYFLALFDYDPLTMSPNPDSCEEELPFREGDTIKVRFITIIFHNTFSKFISQLMDC